MRIVARTSDDLHRFCNQVVAKLGENLSGKPWTVTIEKFKRPRTLDQNSKLHAMMAELAAHVGYTPAEIKEYIKAEHGFKKTVEIGGKVKEIPLGTSQMNVEQLSYLIEQVYQLGAEVECKFQEVR